MLEAEEKSEKVTRYFMAIQNRAEVLKQLTEELFRYSIIMSVQEPMQLEPLCVNDLLEQSLVSFYAALTKSGITPQIDITEKKIIRTLNRTAFLRVLSNILNSTGLGLAIAKTLVEQMHGTITAHYCDGVLSVWLDFSQTAE